VPETSGSKQPQSRWKGDAEREHVSPPQDPHLEGVFGRPLEKPYRKD